MRRAKDKLCQSLEYYHFVSGHSTKSEEELARNEVETDVAYYKLLEDEEKMMSLDFPGE